MSTMIIKLTEEEVKEAVSHYAARQFGLDEHDSRMKVTISVTVNEADRPGKKGPKPKKKVRR